MLDILILLVLLYIAVVITIAGLKVKELLDESIDDQRRIYKDIQAIHDKVNKGGYVQDPFYVENRSRSTGNSSRHVIKTNPPDYIRNKHYEEIKKGATYGYHS